MSGAAIMLALGQRSPGAFALDRVRRLLVPLVFGMIVLVPPQVYLERLYSGRFTWTFLQWLPQAFIGTYPAGNLSWHRLWFLADMVVLTAVLLPVFLWARSPSGRAALDRAAAMTARASLLEFGAAPAAGFILAVVATFLGTSILYLIAVRPWWFVRPLLGLRPMASAARAPAAG